MKKQSKTKIPLEIASEVEYLSDLKCCVCSTRKRAEHIHHLDGNNSNHDINNLAFLCFKHHNEATITGSLARKLSAGAIKKFRDNWYKKVEEQRGIEKEAAVKLLDYPIKKLTEGDLFVAALNANIVLEIDKIQHEYNLSKSDHRSEVIEKLAIYRSYNNITISHHVLDFLEEVAENTGTDNSNDVASALYYSILYFFPSHNNLHIKKQMNSLGEMAAYIGVTVAYDGAIHCRNLSICHWGFAILNHVYRKAVLHKFPQVQKKVLEQYAELDSTLRRPERNDLVNALRLLNVFKNSIGERGNGRNKIPSDLWQIIEVDRKKSHKITPA